MDETRFLGVFDYMYTDSVFDSEISTYYIALGYQLIVEVSFDTLPIDQHHQYRWFTINDLLNDAHVHENTKAYF